MHERLLQQMSDQLKMNMAQAQLLQQAPASKKDDVKEAQSQFQLQQQQQLMQQLQLMQRHFLMGGQGHGLSGLQAAPGN